MTLSPAYGRDYKTSEEAINDFLGGKDFVINMPGMRKTYCSVRDFIGKQVTLRFNRLQDSVLVLAEEQ